MSKKREREQGETEDKETKWQCLDNKRKNMSLAFMQYLCGPVCCKYVVWTGVSVRTEACPFKERGTCLVKWILNAISKKKSLKIRVAQFM